MDLFNEYIASEETVLVFDTGWYLIGNKPLPTAINWPTTVYRLPELDCEQFAHIRDICLEP